MVRRRAPVEQSPGELPLGGVEVNAAGHSHDETRLKWPSDRRP